MWSPPPPLPAAAACAAAPNESFRLIIMPFNAHCPPCASRPTPSFSTLAPSPIPPAATHRTPPPPHSPPPLPGHQHSLTATPHTFPVPRVALGCIVDHALTHALQPPPTPAHDPPLLQARRTHAAAAAAITAPPIASDAAAAAAARGVSGAAAFERRMAVTERRD